MVLTNEHPIMSDAKQLIVNLPCKFSHPVKMPSERAHVVEVIAVDRYDELSEVEILVDGVHIRRQAMNEGAGWNPRQKISLRSNLGTADAPPLVGRKLSQARIFHLVNQPLPGFRPLGSTRMSTLENLPVVLYKLKMRPAIKRAKRQLAKQKLRSEAVEIGRMQSVDKVVEQ